ncbi:MAG: LL-diaminopimelate aminotransferase [Nanoarchaeota archaeon]
MPKRNPNIAKLQAGYLFPEINRRKKAFLDRNPKAKLLSLGIGDTTEPITPHIDKALINAAAGLGTREGYTGYGDEQGMAALREKIASVVYNGTVNGEEVFVSDGAKPDIGRLQLLFGNDAVAAVQDPAYPVYIDSTVMYGKTGKYNEGRKQFENIVYMPCTPENDFFPGLKKFPKADIIFFCSPNNPTGAVATKQQLKGLVEHARRNKSIIVFDSAYAEYISGKNLPKSIYEIKGAKEVAIEVSSFSKPIGFTGVRLGWTIVPNELKFDDGSAVRNDWNRIMATLFNGASNIAQKGALAALDKEGLKEMKQTMAYYMENARIIRKALRDAKCEVYGGENAPYLWARIKGMKSWEAFEYLLERARIVATPGVGFGQNGEGFLRFSAFGHRENIVEAAKRLKDCLK